MPGIVRTYQSNMFKFSFLKTDWSKDALVFLGFLVLFVLLHWRLFIVGSESQLFLYGDNLVAYNNLFYLFSQFSLTDIFGTFIGKNGMLGSYPMSEPQNSIFYLPITLLLIFFKVLNLDAVGLYYELLLSHLLHFILGTFFVYKIAQRVLGLGRIYAVLAGFIYMGIGWNVAWFGTATLSYMIMLLPLTFFTFFTYLKSKRFQDYCWFVLSLGLFLYAGGIVNFFFYLLLNLFLLYGIFAFFKFEKFYSFISWGKSVKEALLLFLVAPILSLVMYSVQLFETYRVSKDIFHSSSSYDYLAFFGTHLYDLVGLIMPKFALMNFGSITNPDMILEFSLANIIYIGIIPLLVLFLGIFCLKSKTVNVFALLLFLNFILSFGGAFFLYDATYFFPGNSLFRGHYKYLMLSGLYLALLVPFILSRFEEVSSHVRYQKIIDTLTRVIWVMLFIAILISFGAMALKFLQKTSPDLVDYYTLATTFSSYFFRVVLLGALSLMSLSLFVRHKNQAALIVLCLVLLLDTSVNYKYAALSQTTIESLTADTFFDCCRGKTIVNDIDKYSQLYFIPEVLGINPLYHYSAIPNTNIVEYNGHIGKKNGFSAEMLAAAGVDGVLTTKLLDDPGFTLEVTRNINNGNYKDLYLYNADGNIHNEWGERPGSVGGVVRYYSVHDPVRAYFTTLYKEKTSVDGAIDYVEGKDFNKYVPALVVGKKKDQDRPMEQRVTQVSFLEDKPAYKRVQLNNEDVEGVFFINIPYSGTWKARIDGKEAALYNANGAFSAVKIHQKNAVVEIYVDTKMSWLFFSFSLFVGVLLCIGALLPDRSRKILKEWVCVVLDRINLKHAKRL